MVGRVFLVLLVFSTVSVAGQSNTDNRPVAPWGKAGKSSKSARKMVDLPRMDEKLGDFIMTEALAAQCRGVQLGILKARRSDLPLDRYLLKWEFSTRGDPFGMALPYQNEPTVQGIYDHENVGVGDCMFFQAALSRAAADLLELQLGDAKLKGARLANARFLETHDYVLQPTVEMRAAREELVRDRQYRMR
jgi:hypothetical protein